MKYVDEMLGKKNWAVVGFTTNEEKFGNKIYKLLNDREYNVVGINPKYVDADGYTVYASLKEAFEAVDNLECVSVVVPEKLSRDVLKTAKELGIPYIWFQPHTYTDEWLESEEDGSIKMVYGKCVLVELSNR